MGVRSSHLRVAVISAETSFEANYLWRLAAEQVAELMLVTEESAETHKAEEFERRLPARYFGKNTLIYRHLVGLEKHLDAFNADVIHVNGELWTLTSQEVLSRPETLIVHGAENIWTHGARLEQIARSLLVKRAVKRIDGYASWNADGGRHISDLSHDRVPTLVLPAVIPSPEFRRLAWRAPEDVFRIMAVGRLSPEKDFETLIRAVSMIAGAHEIEILLCGEGDEAPRLSALARRLNVNLRLMGWLSPEDLAKSLATASCLVQPSITLPHVREQFGRSVAESMTVGLPVLVSSCGELPRLVEDPTCVFPEGDAASLRDLIMQIKDESDRLAALSARHRATAEKWSPARASSELIGFWEHVSSRHSDQP